MTRHEFTGNDLCATTVYGVGPCGYARDDTSRHYLSKADLYRAAVAARPLPDVFAESLRWWLIKDAPMVEIPGADNVRTDVFTTALRAAIGTAEEWRLVAEASRELGRENTISTAPNDQFLAGLHSGQNHQAIYCANMLLRHITQELYRDQVPDEEVYG